MRFPNMAFRCFCYAFLIEQVCLVPGSYLFNFPNDRQLKCSSTHNAGLSASADAALLRLPIGRVMPVVPLFCL
jgi:hypothetical protein